MNILDFTLHYVYQLHLNTKKNAQTTVCLFLHVLANTVHLH